MVLICGFLDVLCTLFFLGILYIRNKVSAKLMYLVV